MSTLTSQSPPVVEEELGPIRKPKRHWSNTFLRLYTWLIILWLALPIAVMVVFSFNDTPGRYNQRWAGFTLEHYGQWWKFDDLREGLLNSLLIAVVNMIVAGAIGTLIGLALGKYRFRGDGTMNLVMFAVIASPELIMGASLLTLFVSFGVGPGLITIMIAHIMFSISFVAVVVRARVMTLDRNTEEAARDLGATPWTTFWLVTFPMIFPAVLSGGLLAFALSIDDFVITQFTAGTTTQTLPLWIWGTTKLGLPPEVNVVGTLIFGIGIVIAIGTTINARRKAK